MKFSISSKALYSRVSAMSKVINSKNTISILNNYLFALKDGKLTITGSDTETTITSTIEAFDTEGEGSVAVDVKTISELLKALPEQPIRIEVEESRYEIKITYQNGYLNYFGVDGNEFPQKGELDEGCKTITLSEKDVKKAIDRTLFATGTEEIRRIMMGILWDIKPDAITFVASDTNKLVRYRNTNIQTGIEASFILPSKPASLLSSVLTESEDPLTVTFDSKSATFETADYCLTCRMINGRYPNYNSVIPNNNPYVLTVDRQSLLNAIRRVGVFAAPGGLVKLEIEDNQVKLTSEDIDMATFGQEAVLCEYSGENMVIGFHGGRMTDVLNNIDCENVTLHLADPSRAGVFVPDKQESGEDLLVLLMPMML